MAQVLPVVLAALAALVAQVLPVVLAALAALAAQVLPVVLAALVVLAGRSFLKFQKNLWYRWSPMFHSIPCFLAALLDLVDPVDPVDLQVLAALLDPAGLALKRLKSHWSPKALGFLADLGFPAVQSHQKSPKSLKSRLIPKSLKSRSILKSRPALGSLAVPEHLVVRSSPAGLWVPAGPAGLAVLFRLKSH